MVRSDDSVRQSRVGRANLPLFACISTETRADVCEWNDSALAKVDDVLVCEFFLACHLGQLFLARDKGFATGSRLFPVARFFLQTCNEPTAT